MISKFSGTDNKNRHRELTQKEEQCPVYKGEEIQIINNTFKK